KSTEELVVQTDLWLAVLRNTRAGLMPPPQKPQPTAEQKQALAQWIKSKAFAADPQNPDPGRVTIRRLNRVEYRNTVRDLLGVDFETDKEFPPDDAGHGFDNIGDVLTLPPMLLEKYMAAARTVVTRAVPKVSRVPAERVISGRSFRGEEERGTNQTGRASGAMGQNSGLPLSYYEHVRVAKPVTVTQAGR